MKYIDTHSHLYHKQFKPDLQAIVERTSSVCSHVFLPNIHLESIEEMHALQALNPQLFYPMMGLHPCDVKADFKTVLQKIESHFSTHTYWGVGETGLDYYWDKTFIEEQKISLDLHIQWAKEKKLPLILHCRDSMDDVIERVKAQQDGNLKGIFHCFTGTEQQAKQIVDLGFLLGIGGVITYKTSTLGTVLPNIPLSNLVLETDSPYLAPVPHRGKRNESSYVSFVAEKLAEILKMSLTEVAEATSANALKLFL